MAETVTTTAEEKVLPGKFKEYYNMALNMLKGDSGYKEQSQAQMKYDIGNALRPAYEKARQNRIMQTGRNAAMIDTDAASRGMGSSTWVTDAKNRLRSQEAQDLANIDSDYAGSLYNALLQRMDNQYSQRQALMNSALGLTQSMYGKWKSEDVQPSSGGSSSGSRRRSPNPNPSPGGTVTMSELSQLVNDKAKTGAEARDIYDYATKSGGVSDYNAAKHDYYIGKTIKDTTGGDSLAKSVIEAYNKNKKKTTR